MENLEILIVSENFIVGFLIDSKTFSQEFLQISLENIKKCKRILLRLTNET